jgi:predicted enzyme related to lactoylglutathione lyase
MADTMAPAIYKPVWVDLASPDPAASREFYARLFGWKVEVEPDPQYGSYAQARAGDKVVAGIGPKMMAEAPTAWSIYIGTGDIAAMMAKVQAAGGTVVVPPMQVGEQGSMAVFQDPSGAFLSAWQPNAMDGFQAGGAGSFGWAELNSRGIDKAVAFYSKAFGWGTKTSSMGEGQPPYIEFLVGDESIAGGMEMNPMVPPAVPSYWMVYFSVDDVDAAFKKAIAGGAREMLAPQDFAGGRFAILADPQGATFGVLKTTR